jgi:SAM-dependent methyltransferase
MSIQSIREYYGQVLKSSKDLKTSACCSTDSLPHHVRSIVKDIHPEVLDRFYGCGSPFPLALEGRTVLDLGCGTGRDVYLLSKLVGPRGRVLGVDMTEEQLEVALRHQDWHARQFGYERSNVQFYKGFIEDLRSAGIDDKSVDLVVSNCVTNLSPDKPALFREVMRVLKPGGEIYFSDVFCDRRLPSWAAQDPVLLGECLGAAMYVEDFRRLMFELGVRDIRVVTQSPIELRDPSIASKLGNARFRSITFRVFKLDLEDKCEDYGQVAIYRGSIPESPHAFLLDDHHLFEAHRPMLVCGNTADMISSPAYREHFIVQGKKHERHFGVFACGPTPAASVSTPATGACC